LSTETFGGACAPSNPCGPTGHQGDELVTVTALQSWLAGDLEGFTVGGRARAPTSRGGSAPGPPSGVKGRCEPPLRSGTRSAYGRPLTPASPGEGGLQVVEALKRPDKPAPPQRSRGRKTMITPLPIAEARTVELAVVPWPDPLVEAVGHRPGDRYIEECWVCVLGPSTSLLWQRLARLCTEAAVSRVELFDLATTLGLGARAGANAPITRSLARLVGFGCAKRAGDVLAVRLALPDLSARQLERVSYSARQAHERWSALKN
jgi:hypothetical protein